MNDLDLDAIEASARAELQAQQELAAINADLTRALLGPEFADLGVGLTVDRPSASDPRVMLEVIARLRETERRLQAALRAATAHCTTCAHHRDNGRVVVCRTCGHTQQACSHAAQDGLEPDTTDVDHMPPEAT